MIACSLCGENFYRQAGRPANGRTCSDCDDPRYAETERYRRRVFPLYKGLTGLEYTELLSIQNNKCAICSMDFTNTSRSTKPNVDHDHSTGLVRGLLCGNCNRGIGSLQDSVDILEKAKVYLAHSREYPFHGDRKEQRARVLRTLQEQLDSIDEASHHEEYVTWLHSMMNLFLD